MSRKCVCCVGFAVIQEGIEFGTMIYVRLGVAPIEEKLVQHQLRWFGLMDKSLCWLVFVGLQQGQHP